MPTPAVGFPLPTDPRRDMIREAIAARLVAEFSDVESKLKEIVQTGEVKTRRADARPVREAPTATPGGPVTATTERAGAAPTSTTTTTTTTADRPPPTSEQVQRALQLLQRDAGLTVTGRFDDATVALLGRLGLASPPASIDAKGAPKSPPPTTTTPPSTPPSTPPAAEPRAERKPVDLAAQVQRRQAIAGQEQLLRARLQPAPSSSPSTAEAFRAEVKDSPPLDRALDPARLLASLVAAGFKGANPSNLSEALQAFQAAKALPPSGQLDKATAAALATAGVVSAESGSALAAAVDHAHAGEGARSSTSAASSRDRVDVTSNTKGSGAATQAATTRAPAASPEEARERARLESLLAQAEASERGVQAQTGDLAATAGNAATAGQATGVSGSGGTGGGTDTGGDDSAHATDGPAGDETSTGNSAAGDDDDHDHEDRGEAVAAGQAEDRDGDDGLIPDGHYRIEKLSVQVLAALKDIARLNDESGPVHYTWDVTLYRPGIYTDGQPAEAVWHLVVDRAHAFDPVWQRAAHAIAARLLYAEPEAIAPSLDEFLAALRRARVR